MKYLFSLWRKEVVEPVILYRTFIDHSEWGLIGRYHRRSEVRRLLMLGLIILIPVKIVKSTVYICTIQFYILNHRYCNPIYFSAD